MPKSKEEAVIYHAKTPRRKEDMEGFDRICLVSTPPARCPKMTVAGEERVYAPGVLILY